MHTAAMSDAIDRHLGLTFPLLQLSCGDQHGRAMVPVSQLSPQATHARACLVVCSEAERLASLRHPCVMSFYGIMSQEAGGATIAEYMCHGSLRSGLTKIRKKASCVASQDTGRPVDGPSASHATLLCPSACVGVLYRWRHAPGRLL